MRTFLLAAVLFAASTSLRGQHIAAGIRSGAGFWKGEAYDKEARANRTEHTAIWEKEVFVRHESAKHFAYEIGINEVDGQSDGEIFGTCGVGSPPYYSTPSSMSIKDKYYGLNLRLQYGFSCARASRLVNYPGIAVAPTLHVREYAEVMNYYGPAGKYDVANVTTTYRDLGLQLAIEDMIRYRIGPHVDIHSLVGYKVNVGSTLLYRAFAVQLGIAYLF